MEPCGFFASSQMIKLVLKRLDLVKGAAAEDAMVTRFVVSRRFAVLFVATKRRSFRAIFLKFDFTREDPHLGLWSLELLAL